MFQLPRSTLGKVATIIFWWPMAISLSPFYLFWRLAHR